MGQESDPVDKLRNLKKHENALGTGRFLHVDSLLTSLKLCHKGRACEKKICPVNRSLLVAFSTIKVACFRLIQHERAAYVLQLHVFFDRYQTTSIDNQGDSS